MGILIGTPKKTPRKGEISRCLLFSLCIDIAISYILASLLGCFYAFLSI